MNHFQLGSKGGGGGSSIACVFIVTLLHYFHISTFFWMFVEGKRDFNAHELKGAFRFNLFAKINPRSLAGTWFIHYLLKGKLWNTFVRDFGGSNGNNKSEILINLFLGLYLYILVVETLTRENFKLRVYVCIGWGKFNEIFKSSLDYSVRAAVFHFSLNEFPLNRNH